uniref:Uncharacterized protein n=1 Tax=Meloidogyne incognita TaxID=6306 RepID=A0A914N9A5_MELIC
MSFERARRVESNGEKFSCGLTRPNRRLCPCPVLLGDKWTANCFIFEIGQEFFRPCGLDPSIQERYVGDLGGPEPRKYPNISPY